MDTLRRHVFFFRVNNFLNLRLLLNYNGFDYRSLYSRVPGDALVDHYNANYIA
jgi:hypothetical protein